MKTSAETLGMAGRLKLVVGLDGVGKCVLREQYATALHRVLRLVPGDHPTEGVIYIVNPAGGVAQGDTLEADIRVESGAHALVTMPGATKVYRMERAEATSRTSLHVLEGAMLEYLPEPLIPFRGARFVEELSLDLEAGGRAIAWEMLAPGRVASGESLEYDLLALRLRVTDGGRVVLRERSDIVPSEDLTGPVGLGSWRHYGILLAFGTDGGEVEACVRGVMEEGGEVCAGVTRLEGRGVLLKGLAAEGRHLSGFFEKVRRALVPILAGRPPVHVRRC